MEDNKPAFRRTCPYPGIHPRDRRSKKYCSGELRENKSGTSKDSKNTKAKSTPSTGLVAGFPSVRGNLCKSRKAFLKTTSFEQIARSSDRRFQSSNRGIQNTERARIERSQS